MKQHKSILLAFLFLLFSFTQPVNAEVFKFYGARPAGMGGAYVGVAEGSLAQHWNPAGLGLSKHKLGSLLPAEVRLADLGTSVEISNDILERADNIANLADKIDRLQAKGGSSSMDIDDYKDFTEVLDTVNSFSEANLGVLGNLYLGANIQYWKLSISVNNYSEFSASPFVDLDNINLIDNLDAIGSAPSGGTTTDPTDSSLINSRNDLATVIGGLATSAGLDTGGLTSEQAANAVINEAVSNNVASTTIADNISSLKSSYDDVQALLPSAGSGSFDDNKTNLTLRGASITEFSVGGGGSFPFQEGIPFFESLLFGGNLKMLQTKVGYGEIGVLDQDAKIEDVFDNMKDNTKDSIAFTVDLGVLLDKKEDWNFRSGLVFRNITSPSFDAPEDNLATTSIKEGEGGKFNLGNQVRFGSAYWLLDRWIVAFDVDVTENETALKGYKSRLFSFGTEFKLANSKTIDLALRAGVYKNLAESASSFAYTGGIGLTLLHVSLDISGSVSSKTAKTRDGQSVPASSSVSASLYIDF